MTEHRNGGAAVVETLAAHGVDTIFGIPGTHNLEIYRHLQTTGIRAVTPRHEQGAGYAAEAFARVTGRPGVVVATSGPGLTNTMTAAATAYAESQPMLILSSGMPTGAEGQDLGQLHEAKNTSAAMDHLVRWSRRVRSADEAAEAVTDAFGSFTGPKRPLHVEIPFDVLEQQWSGQPRIAAKASAPQTDPDALRRATDVLAAAVHPVIIAGGGAVDAQTELTALAEALGAPVATTVNGKGVVDEAHPLSVGASIRLRAVQKAAADSDALLVAGTELGDSDLWEGQIRGRTVIRCDIEPAN
jgi:thiamine pyrophosphate-dependent acetolactate synthase large subunit-like protein